MSIKDAVRQLTLMRIVPGDVVLCRGMRMDQMRVFVDLWKKVRGPRDNGVLFICLQNSQTMARLDEHAMNMIGWYRKETQPQQEKKKHAKRQSRRSVR
jgi:hypothetical protein